ncbi:MAG: sensor histidine kinase [Lactococcus plantarum]|nr:sensor histidine kinase [Lactococcus plantarum]
MSKQLGLYFKFCAEQASEFICFFVLEGMIILIFLLQGLNLDFFWVALFTPLLLFLMFQIAAFLRFLRLHQFLSTVEVEMLPEFTDTRIISQDYQKIIVALDQHHRHNYQKLANFDKSLLDLITLWTHQMKVPLSALDLMVQTNRLTASDVENQVLELDNYLNILLSYLRLQDTATDFRFEDFDVADIIRTIIKKYANQFILKDLSVTVTGSYQVTSDKKWLSVAIEQLINNAVKYTKKGSVTIILDQNILISDTGIGILTEDIPRIFEHGFTGFNGRKMQKSTGLGLYLTKDILNQLNFDIKITSQIDQGTEVKISQVNKKYNSI